MMCPDHELPIDRRPISTTFLVLAVSFCVCLIVSNLMEVKVVDIGRLTITAGVVVFPISYIINDCIVEIYGLARARFVIWLGFVMNLIVTLLIQLCLALPPGVGFDAQESMEIIYGAVPRIVAASFAAFLCGSFMNAYVMARMKSKSGRKGFSVRAIVSTIWGESVDSLIFFPGAFWGVLPNSTIIRLIITQIILKTLYEIIILPVTISVVRLLRKIENQ